MERQQAVEVVEDVEVGDPEWQPAVEVVEDVEVGMELQPVVGMEPLLDPEQAGAPADPQQACRSEAGWSSGGRGGKAAPGEEHRRLGWSIRSRPVDPKHAGAPAEGEGRPHLGRSTDAQTGPLRRGRGGMTAPGWRSGAGGGEG